MILFKIVFFGCMFRKYHVTYLLSEIIFLEDIPIFSQFIIPTADFCPEGAITYDAMGT